VGTGALVAAAVAAGSVVAACVAGGTSLGIAGKAGVSCGAGVAVRRGCGTAVAEGGIAAVLPVVAERVALAVNTAVPDGGVSRCTLYHLRQRERTMQRTVEIARISFSLGHTYDLRNYRVYHATSPFNNC
jgi:hypothetical protein